ncbi:MAG: molybdopterin-dependent oxidoreductase, partial [Deltaproteobacteria bacterium]|nr:molybdopterin-dependent oxidoreductase [Deltaproteobacteria bacterium]
MSGDTVEKKGTCPVCGHACHIIAHMDGNRVEKIKADSDTLFGHVCNRGANTVDYHYHSQRLNYPLKRKGARGAAEWEKISWDQAMDEIAERLERTKKEYGPESVLVLGGSPHGPGDSAAWKWCNMWGTPNFFHLGKNCGAAELPVECAMYGYDTIAGWATFLDPEKTGACIMWGANLSESIPRLWEFYTMSQSMGMKLIVVDPRPTECAKAADIWLQLRPGTDGALALGMLNVIISEGIYDKAFVEKWCTGFDELKGLAEKYPLDKVSEITFVPKEKIIEAA